ncbi:SH3 beta-barrel fold-containing protein [uncultured Bacteroides sp.]|uniref:SH3 beta-barrel fold-containing protein n=1 Tax=uncultured Bacteroides sp. TaxID=162156 RepID=UPI002AAB6ABF|nr:SH3 beta-barrel fold-containing protein [uncultured Bacteroides sp.]
MFVETPFEEIMTGYLVNILLFLHRLNVQVFSCLNVLCVDIFINLFFLMMEERKLERRRLMFRAAAIQQENGFSKSAALLMAHGIERLIDRMHVGEVNFCYTKEDGQVRRARGTLTGYEHVFKKPYAPRPENTFVVYYDLDKCGWRTFRAANFLRLEGDV